MVQKSRVSAAPRAVEPEPEPRERRVRLRHVLVAAIVGVLGWQLAPRAQAAWTLRERATELADYALCMAGPTAPALVRDQDPEFRQLLRRRLLVSMPEATPFAACAGMAADLTGSTQSAAGHRAQARDFVEYGLAVPGAAQNLSLDRLSVTTAVLRDLTEHAWPFERRGYTRLVVSSSHAKEAPHPVPFAAPLLGRGLPGTGALYEAAWAEQGRWFMAHGHSANLSLFESADLGQSWRQVSLSAEGLAGHAGRCGDFDSDNGFVFESGGDTLLVHSFVGERAAYTATLPGRFGITAAACDAQAAVVLLEHATPTGVEHVPVLCPHLGNCGQLPMNPQWLTGPFDIARVAGTTVLISVDQGVVRARSSRDNGQTWTSAMIAFDWQNPANPSADVKVPSKLLKLGGRLLLHGEGKLGQTYPLLFSDDAGASWRGQAEPSPARKLPERPLRREAEQPRQARR